MRLDKYTIKSQEAIQEAQQLAALKGHQQIDPLHLLACLLKQQQGVVIPIINKLGANKEEILAKTQDTIESLPQVSGAQGQYISNELNDIF